MKGTGASCTVRRSGVIFSEAWARPTGLAVRSARSTNRIGDTEKIPGIFISFLDHKGNRADGVWEGSCIVYV